MAIDLAVQTHYRYYREPSRQRGTESCVTNVTEAKVWTQRKA